MTKKQIGNALSSYFDELLVDPNYSALVNDASGAAQISNKATPPPTIQPKRATNNETFTHPLPQKETSPETRSEKVASGEQGELAAARTDHGAEAPKASHGPPLPATEPLVKEKPLMTRYEQHKQRLEKMLQQVTALKATPDIQVPPPAEIQTEAKAAPLIETNFMIDEADKPLECVAYQPLPPLTSEWLENGRPNWAQDAFDILLIDVNGLKLALPLMALGHIQTLEDNVTALFGRADWFMGLQKTACGNIKTVDTAKFVMPERCQEHPDYHYVVSINGSSWGLAVDGIHQPMQIDPDAIRWRSRRNNHRPWMAGTVKEHMCVLLDIPSMEEVLQEHGQKQGSQQDKP